MPEQTPSNEQELRRVLQKRGGRMPAEVERLIRAVLDEPDGEITHAQCHEALPKCIDAALEGKRLADLFPAVKRHLDMCAACAAEFADLMDLTRAELAGEIPIPEDIPAPDLSFLPGAMPSPALQPAPESFPVWVFAKQKAADLLAALELDREKFLAMADQFYGDLTSLGLERTLEPIAVRRKETPEPDPTLVEMAVTYVAIATFVADLTPEKIDTLAAEGQLCKELEESAQATVLKIGVNRVFGWQVATKLAQHLCQDPEGLKTLLRFGNRS